MIEQIVLFAMSVCLMGFGYSIGRLAKLEEMSRSYDRCRKASDDVLEAYKAENRALRNLLGVANCPRCGQTGCTCEERPA